MTKDRSPPRRAGHIDNIFDEADIISVYTDREALEDGLIFPVKELATLNPGIKWDDGPFEYVTTNLCQSKGYFQEDRPVQVANFIDLFRNVQEAMKQAGPDHFYNTNVEFPDGTRGEVYAVRNSSGRYTILLPEDY